MEIFGWSNRPYRGALILGARRRARGEEATLSLNSLLGDYPQHERGAYRLGPRPLGRGGQAEVFPAEHRATGVRVALKRLSSWGVDAVARMQREIEFGQLALGSDHVMPVLDYSATYDWFVMPLADGNAEDARSSLSDDGQLVAMVMGVCSALEVAHRAGWLHRDLKPANLLSLDGCWMVADWGLGRRPRGDTTFAGRTAIGEFFGTDGFAAPEQAIDAHETTASADLYSLGQIIGWARTGRTPRTGSPLLPDEEPWRSIVAAVTQEDPAARPQSVHEFRELMRT